MQESGKASGVDLASEDDVFLAEKPEQKTEKPDQKENSKNNPDQTITNSQTPISSDQIHNGLEESSTVENFNNVHDR